MTGLPKFPHVRRPCDECPWRKGRRGQFGPERYEALAATVSGEWGAPVFACHKTTEGEGRACAGWLAVCGRDHIGVRLAIVMHRLEPADLGPREGWPELYESYEALARANGAHLTLERDHGQGYREVPTRREA